MKPINQEREEAKRSLKRTLGLKRILGNSQAVSQLRQQIDSIAACDVNVLISGESGVGKELAACAIHYLSSRASKPFIPVNCGAIPENLFENELFGHRKGAYTDASLQQDGLVKEAEGGTLFLDEIGVITPYIQVKLLRLLQEKEYKPLGDAKTRKADVRILAATNRNLETLVKEGTFREDLFFRLNIVSLSVPSLRTRREDIPLLVGHFIKKYSKEYGKPVKGLSKEVMAALLSYSWPGNIRELENKIQHALVMTEGDRITVSHMDIPVSGTQGSEEIPKLERFKEAKHRAVEAFEKDYLVFLMAACSGNVVNAAARAGKSRTALWNLLAKYHLHPKQFMAVAPQKR